MHQIQLLKKYGLSVRGIRGQHLLVDENIQKKMVKAACPKLGDTIVEIGPGLGAITFLLLQSGAETTAIEKDPRFVQILSNELVPTFQNLTLIKGDILKTDLCQFAKRSKIKVVGNIPYYITSQILLHLIEHRRGIDCVYLTVQREIADRVFAEPGTKAYGRLSLLTRFYADAKRLFDISRTCFTPVPDVDSTLMELKFHTRAPRDIDEDQFFTVVKAAFGERRKNILNALSNGLKGRRTKEEIRSALAKAKINETDRAENLMLKDFVRLTEHVGTN